MGRKRDPGEISLSRALPRTEFRKVKLTLLFWHPVTLFTTDSLSSGQQVFKSAVCTVLAARCLYQSVNAVISTWDHAVLRCSQGSPALLRLPSCIPIEQTNDLGCYGSFQDIVWPGLCSFSHGSSVGTMACLYYSFHIGHLCSRLRVDFYPA